MTSALEAVDLLGNLVQRRNACVLHTRSPTGSRPLSRIPRIHTTSQLQCRRIAGATEILATIHCAYFADWFVSFRTQIGFDVSFLWKFEMHHPVRNSLYAKTFMTCYWVGLCEQLVHTSVFFDYFTPQRLSSHSYNCTHFTRIRCEQRKRHSIFESLVAWRSATCLHSYVGLSPLILSSKCTLLYGWWLRCHSTRSICNVICIDSNTWFELRRSDLLIRVYKTVSSATVVIQKCKVLWGTKSPRRLWCIPQRKRKIKAIIVKATMMGLNIYWLERREGATLVVFEFSTRNTKVFRDAGQNATHILCRCQYANNIQLM